MGVEDELRKMLDDESLPAHLRLGVLKELGKHGEPASSDGGDPVEVMKSLVAKFCGEWCLETWGEPGDPMRDLDLAEELRRSGARPFEVSDFAWSWLPVAPLRPREADRAVTAAARRLGLGEGPFEPPGAHDELSKRRRQRAS
jgi:hypothetical protein